MQSWDDLFPAEDVKTLGLETPEARAEYFMDLWFDWESTNIVLPKKIIPGMMSRHENYIGRNNVMQFAKKHNLKEFWEFQVRGREVRFKDEDMALLFRLTL